MSAVKIIEYEKVSEWMTRDAHATSSGGWIKNGIMLDLYNQALCCDTTPTITTRINSCSHYWAIRIEYEKVNKRQDE